MKKNILFLLTTIFVSSSICISAFACENDNVIHKFGEEISISIDDSFNESIELDTINLYKVNVEENSIQFTDEADKDVKFIFNDTINLNDISISDALINSISKSDQISVLHTHSWKLVGTWESGGQTGPIYYCSGCGSMELR